MPNLNNVYDVVYHSQKQMYKFHFIFAFVIFSFGHSIHSQFHHPQNFLSLHHARLWFNIKRNDFVYHCIKIPRCSVLDIWCSVYIVRYYFSIDRYIIDLPSVCGMKLPKIVKLILVKIWIWNISPMKLFIPEGVFFCETFSKWKQN